MQKREYLPASTVPLQPHARFEYYPNDDCHIKKISFIICPSSARKNLLSFIVAISLPHSNGSQKCPFPTLILLCIIHMFLFIYNCSNIRLNNSPI